MWSVLLTAKQHQKMVRRHTYENMYKPPGPLQSKSSPCLLLQKPPSSRRLAQHRASVGRGKGVAPGPTAQLTASTKKGYENVVFGEARNAAGSPAPPRYEEIEGSYKEEIQSSLPGPGRGRMASLTSSTLSEPLSPSPPLPDRKYSDTDLLTSPQPDLQNSRYTPPDSAPSLTTTPPSPAEERARKNSLQHAPMHQLSDKGQEYAIIQRGRPQKQQQQQQQQGEKGREGGVAEPPALPLRAHQRMSSREDLLTDTLDSANVAPEIGVVSECAELGDHAPCAKQGYQSTTAYSVVQLDPDSGKMVVKEDEERPRSLSPQPYEVASPTPGATPHHELNTGPHYEEIESKDDMSGERAAC